MRDSPHPSKTETGTQGQFVGGHLAFALAAAGFQAEVQRLGQRQPRPQVPGLVGAFGEGHPCIRGWLSPLPERSK